MLNTLMFLLIIGLIIGLIMTITSPTGEDFNHFIFLQADNDNDYDDYIADNNR